jgi:transposase InsO family protein
MSKARLVITAVLVEGRSQAEVARTYGVSESFVSRALARYRAEGEAAFEPRSRKPRASPRSTSKTIVDEVTALRQDLVSRGLDAGPKTIVWHLQHHRDIFVSRATVARILAREGLVTPQPRKRPRSSYVRFEADMPNECWQSDVTHYWLAPRAGADARQVEILTFVDDHSRAVMEMSCHEHVTGRIVLLAFRRAVQRHGIPASTLTDNGMVFTTRFAGGRGGRNAFETELRRLGVRQINSTPNHPQTCGKVERLQQTLKKWLAAKHRQPTSVAMLQRLCNQFVEEYNAQRPHSSLTPQRPPAVAYLARPKAVPGDRSGDTHLRVRHDRADERGKVTLRVDGRLYSLALGSQHARTRVILLVDDLHVRAVDAATGELLRELVLDLSKRYQGTGMPPGPRPKPRP